MASRTPSILFGALMMLSEFGPSTDWQLLIRLINAGFPGSAGELRSAMVEAEAAQLISVRASSEEDPLEKYVLTDLGRKLCPPGGAESTVRNRA